MNRTETPARSYQAENLHTIKVTRVKRTGSVRRNIYTNNDRGNLYLHRIINMHNKTFLDSLRKYSKRCTHKHMVTSLSKDKHKGGNLKRSMKKKFHLQRNLKKFSANFSVDTVVYCKCWQRKRKIIFKQVLHIQLVILYIWQKTFRCCGFKGRVL